MSRPAEDVSTVERWALPTVEGPRIDRRGRTTVAELEARERAAWEEAYAQGRAAGMTAMRHEIDARVQKLDAQVQRLAAVLDLLAEPLRELDTDMERQLVTLAYALARQLIRRELSIDPAQVIGIVRDTVALLPAAARDVRVHLHPEDAALVRERLAEPAADRAWRLIEDPVQSRGGCRVTTDSSQIDARLETRLAAAMVALFGDDRGPDTRDAAR